MTASLPEPSEAKMRAHPKWLGLLVLVRNNAAAGAAASFAASASDQSSDAPAVGAGSETSAEAAVAGRESGATNHGAEPDGAGAANREWNALRRGWPNRERAAAGRSRGTRDGTQTRDHGYVGLSQDVGRVGDATSAQKRRELAPLIHGGIFLQ